MRKPAGGLKGGLALTGILVGVLLVIVAIIYAISMAHLNNSQAEPQRSGVTAVDYAQPLTDPQSSTALLNLIESKPGYDTYAITYPCFVDGGPITFAYRFSTDSIVYQEIHNSGTPTVYLTWQGHGIQRIQREAQGGTLDDN